MASPLRAETRACAECGVTLAPAHARGRLAAYCSRVCSDRAWRGGRVVRVVVPPEPTRRGATRRCVDCGTTFGPPRRGPWSERCRRCQMRRKWGNDHHRGRTPIAVRRAVIARDGHRCGICGRLVDASLRAPHPFCLSIDHVVPIIAGGDDSLANLQVAHLLCNVVKGDRLPAWMERAAA